MIQVFHSSLKFIPVNSGQVIFFHTKAFFHLKYDFSYSSCDCLAILTVASVVFIHFPTSNRQCDILEDEGCAELSDRPNKTIMQIYCIHVLQIVLM
jgi:uncharacterized membrane protein